MEFKKTQGQFEAPLLSGNLTHNCEPREPAVEEFVEVSSWTFETSIRADCGLLDLFYEHHAVITAVFLAFFSFMLRDELDTEPAFLSFFYLFCSVSQTDTALHMSRSPELNQVSKEDYNHKNIRLAFKTSAACDEGTDSDTHHMLH